MHEFILLFPNQTGVKYSTQDFDYKKARESIVKNKIELPKGVKVTKFTYSATPDFLWIKDEKGNYERLDFFNFNKAFRKEKKKFYLLDFSGKLR